MISNNQCVCAPGYAASPCGTCTLSCSASQFPFQGGCAICPLNTIFNAQINGCDCPSGFYKNNYGTCEQLVLRPLNCSNGQYFDLTNGCVACPGSCKTCSSATRCTACSTNGYTPNSNGQCVTNCGDGIIVGTETCDTGNSFSPGCTNCKVQTGYTCNGQPSVCQSNTPVTPTVPTTPTTPTNPTTPSNNGNTNSTGANTLAGLTQSGNATVNSNNVFVTLLTNPTFTFANPTDMQTFMKSSFPSGPKPTVYCSQRNSPNLNTFDCLMIYPSGVPNQIFSINFSYNYQGRTGACTVTVNPFAASNARKSP